MYAQDDYDFERPSVDLSTQKAVPDPSFVTAGHYKVSHFYTATQHTMSPEVLIMSPRAWGDLSAEDRKIFRDAAKQSSKFMREQWQDWERRSEKEAIESGVTVFNAIDRKPFEDVTKPLRDALRADPAYRPLIERIDAAR